jgi:hypothetical protein
MADPTLVEGNQGAPAGRTEPQPLLAHVTADFQSIRPQDKNATRHVMEGVVARDKDGNTIPCFFKSHRASSRKAPSRGLSRSTSVADLNPMASTLPLRMVASATLAESRWHSSRALNDCPPKLPMEEEDSDDSSPNVGDLAPCSPRKTSQAKTRSKTSLQPVSTGADKALPPKTVCRASLAETRWDSSRSLSDNAPKTPSPRRKKQKDSGSHLRSLRGIMRDAPDNKSISPPAPPADKTPSPPRRTRQLIRTSSPPLESPTCVVTIPSDHNSKAMPCKGENSETARKQKERLYSQSAFRDEDSVGSVESEERRARAQGCSQ